MPELPDVTVYVEALGRRVLGRRLERIRLASPFLLRTVDPPLGEAEGRTVRRVLRLGKRIVFELAGHRDQPANGDRGGADRSGGPGEQADDHLYLAIHLMIGGRLRWGALGTRLPRRLGQAAFDFEGGTLLLTEAGTKRKAALHLLRDRAALGGLDKGGIEPLGATLETFRGALLRENHTLKRALTDPRLFSGIGNAYSDEILHRARLSPLRLTRHLHADEVARLRDATASVLAEWTDRLRRETGDGFPGKVTAFREGMAVHGRYRKPCPACGTAVQRIVCAENECNYCPRCQTEGRLLADRALSRLLHGDWPRTLDELESGTAGQERTGASYPVSPRRGTRQGRSG